MMYLEDDDAYVDQLLENIDLLDQFLETDYGDETKEPLSSISSLSTRSSSTSDSDNAEDLSHTIFVQKRRYHKRKGEVEEIQQGGRGKRRYYPIILPRLVKHDIRRKFPEMYANVMNSSNFKLMTTFFKKFFIPNSKMVKLPPSPSSPIAEIDGVDLLTYYFLVLAQSTPDRITQVSNIQIKQRSNTEEVIITCNIKVSYTQMYDLQPGLVAKKVLQECSQLTAIEKNSDFPTPRKRKLEFDSEVFHPALRERLFDPIKGDFCRTRLTRLDAPVAFSGGSFMTMKINELKHVTDLTFAPLETVVVVSQNFCHY